MAQVISIVLEPYPRGNIVIQENQNLDEFIALISPHVPENAVERYKGSYGRAIRPDTGGFCAVYPFHIPWLIVVIGTTIKSVKSSVLHEVVHLGETLTVESGTPLLRESEEVRARLVQLVYNSFLEEYEVVKPATVSKETSVDWDWITMGALFMLLALTILRGCGFDALHYLAD